MTQLISIIIPLFNAEKYIKECIASVISQDYTDFEVIVINDGSTDHSLDIVQEISHTDPRVLLFDKKNEGVSIARNFGLSKAKGNYVMFVDSDDLLPPQALSNLATAARKTGADIVAGECIQFWDGATAPEIAVDNENKLSLTHYKAQDALRDMLYQKRIANASHSKLFSTNLFSDEAFPPGIRVGEDLYANCLAFSRAQRVVWIDKEIYLYRQRTGSAVRGDFDSSRLQTIDLFISLEQNSTNLETSMAISNRIFMEALFILMRTNKQSPKSATNRLKEVIKERRRIVLTDTSSRSIYRLYAAASYVSLRLLVESLSLRDTLLNQKDQNESK